MNKRVLLVIKDNLEYKNLLENIVYFRRYLNEKEVFVSSPVNIDKKFTSDISIALERRINFIDWDNGNAFVNKTILYIRNLLFYFSTFNYSYSSKQKLFLYLFFKEDFIFRKKLEKYRIPNVFVKVSKFLLRNIDYIAFKKGKNNFYDDVVFFRSDASQQMNYYRSCIGKYTTATLFVRNVDAITLKGVFSIPFNKTYVADEMQLFRLKNLHDPLHYGEAFIIEEQPSENIKSKSNKRNINVLFATSHPKFVPLEPCIVEKANKVLVKKYKERLKFTIRLHPADKKERYKKLFGKVSFEDCKANYIIYESEWGSVNFFNIETVQRYNELLSKSDCLICCTSTIVVDAHKVGVKNLIYINDPQYFYYAELYKREHLLDIIDRCGVRVCTDISTLTINS